MNMTLTEARKALTNLAHEDAELVGIRGRLRERLVAERQRWGRAQFWRAVQATRALDDEWSQMQRRRG